MAPLLSPRWNLLVPCDSCLRVLLVPSAYYPHAGGIEEMTRRLALALREQGHASMVLTNRWPAGTARREVLHDVPVRRIRFHLPAARPWALMRFAVIAPLSAFELARTVRAFDPHVIHLMGAGPNAVYVAALRRALGRPIVLTAHGEFRNDAHGAFESSRTLRMALRVLLRRAAAVTACSRVVLDELGEDLEITASARVLPNAIEPAEFAGAASPPDGLGRYLLVAGRLVDQKGIDLALRAFARAGNALSGHRLVIAGDGPEHGSLARLATELGLDGRVSFLGTVARPQFAELMCGAEVFVFPSRREAFGLALLEAMAAGTPAVASRVGGIPEFARDGENALLVGPEDVDQLAAALVRLVGDGELRARIIHGGRAQAEHHSWERTIPRYEELYADVVQ